MKSKNKIIYIGGTPISKIQGDKLDIDNLVKSGFEIEYWDLTNLFYSKESLDLYFGGHPDFRFKFPLERKFFDKYAVKKELEKIEKNTIFCFNDIFIQSHFWLLRYFKKIGIPYFVGPRRTPPEVSVVQKNAPNNLLFRLLISIFDGSIIKKLTSSVESNINNIFLHQLNLLIYRNTDYYKKPDFVIGCGLIGKALWTDSFCINKFVSIDSNDVIWTKIPDLVNERYCVYVDESIVYSPDRGLYEPDKRNSASSDFESFKKNMRLVFDNIEAILGLKVIIACSAKYKYQNESIYGDRQMIYDKTNQLIQHSDFALGHCSSGLFQAIISKKPIILLDDPSFSDFKKNNIKSFSEFLKAKIMLTNNFSSNDFNVELKNENVEHYEILEEKYFKEKNSIQSYHQFIVDFFNKY